MNINYFNSPAHIRAQCDKIEKFVHRRINQQKIHEMNTFLFNTYYRRKPINMRDDVFLEKLSIKSIYDVIEKVIEEERRKGRPIHLNEPIKSSMKKPTNAIGVNGEQVNMSYQRLPQLQTNNTPVQATNYQSMINELNLVNERPNEEEIMKQIKETNWLNPRKARDNNNQNTQPLQTPIQPQVSVQQIPPQIPQQQINPQPIQYQQINPQIPQQINQQIPQQINPIPQINQQTNQQNQSNDFQSAQSSEGFNLTEDFGGLLSGISSEERAKFENNNQPVSSQSYHF